jgi:hypothetical protein
MKKRSTKKLTIENIFAPKTSLQLAVYVGVVAIIFPLMFSGNLWAGIGLIILIFLFLILERHEEAKTRKESKLNIENLKVTYEKVPPQPSPGLILSISPYSPQKSELKDKTIIDPLFNIILESDEPNQSDFDKIDIYNSNLKPPLEAINHHRQSNKLRELWLISTKVDDIGKGSETTARILEKYLKFKYGDLLTIHQHPVSENNYYNIYQTVDNIFQSAGYKEEKIVADITGGTKMMSIALTLACIPPKRLLQYMDSQRDWEGNPLEKGEMKPILIDIDSISNIHNDSEV